MSTSTSTDSLLAKAINIINTNISYLRSHIARKTIEEQTKQSLILPLLSALGYDIFSPSEIIMEAQSITNSNEHVDYCVKISENNQFYIEAKHLDKPLENVNTQLNRYFQGDVKTKIAIVTDGNVYHFYTDTKNKNILDIKPYYVLNIESLSDDDILFLSSFHKENFSASTQQQFALMQKIFLFASQIEPTRLLTSTFTDIAGECVLEPSYLLEYEINKAESILHCHSSNDDYKQKMFGLLEPKRDNIDIVNVLSDEKENKDNFRSTIMEKKNSRDLLLVPSDVVFYFSDKTGEEWNGRMRVVDGKCILLADSILGPIKEYESGHKHTDKIKIMRKQNANKISETVSGKQKIISDFDPVSSPSAAAGIINGGAANGWDRWRDENGKKLDEYAQKRK